MENRQAVVRGIVMGFNEGTFSNSKGDIAKGIFWVMAKDAKIRVREALTLNLRHSSALLNNGTQALAKDASDSVALLVLQFSEVLSEKN
ncbi:hypothetical protein OAS67_05460 [Alphaproteobacteria bacterium]|nr:hypothetical protein [Alphaproteobacteria bacterium]